MILQGLGFREWQMSSVQVLRLAAIVLALGLAVPANADSDAGERGEKGEGRSRAAPAPLVGTGILGLVVLTGGLLAAARRKR